MTLIPGGKVIAEEVFLSDVVFDEGLVRLLVMKGVITWAEMLVQIQAVKEDMEERGKGRRQKEQ